MVSPLLIEVIKMWNEIWNFVKDNIGWVLVGAVGLIILLKKIYI